jgi:hypothetical protein
VNGAQYQGVKRELGREQTCVTGVKTGQSGIKSVICNRHVKEESSYNFMWNKYIFQFYEPTE